MRKFTAIVFILVLTMAATLISISLAIDGGIEVKVVMIVGPNPIGVNQQVLVIFGVHMPPPGATISPTTPRWENLSVTLTKPDGHIETRGPYKSDPTGLNYFIFTPAVTGKYYFSCKFPGQVINGVYYKPGNSTVVALTVQEEQIPSYPAIGLPKEYWSRPIYSMNREWRTLSGNWLGLGGGSHGVGTYGPNQNPFHPYTSAPNSGHIMWTKELTLGGLVGGEFGELGYYGGQPYEARFHPPIIINGRLYYNLYDVQRYQYYQGFTCVDLRTGETLWTRNGTISKGNTIYWGTPNEYGIVPPLLWSTWGSTWYVYDAFTGDLLVSFANASSVGVFAMDENGNLLAYVLSRARRGYNWLAMWNGTKAMQPTGIDFRPRLGTYDWRRGIEWNATIPDVAGDPTIGNINSLINPTVLICEGFISETPENPVFTFTQVAYSLKKGEEGKQLWVANRTDIGDRARRANYRNIIGDELFIEYHREEMHYHSYNIYTGGLVWVSDSYDTNDWAVYTRTVAVAYHKLFSLGMDGYVCAFDLKNGKLLWKTNPSEIYVREGGVIDAPYGHHTFTTHSAYVVADGKIFAATGEHSPNQPLWRSGQLYVLDVDNGELLWRLTGWWDCGQPVISDGYFVGFNGYDNRLYCIGKGPSVTTVTAPDTTVPLGSSVVIRGTVMDISLGTQDNAIKARFPNGVPAVADECMTPWMEYVYMQQPRPSDVKGVWVTFDAIGPDGKWIHIGGTHTDASGFFSVIWTPPAEGHYTIVATFPGSESYWSSYAETSVGVTAAPPQIEIPEAPQPLDYTPMFTGVYVAVAIAILIGIYSIYDHRKLRKQTA